MTPATLPQIQTEHVTINYLRRGAFIHKNDCFAHTYPLTYDGLHFCKITQFIPKVQRLVFLSAVHFPATCSLRLSCDHTAPSTGKGGVYCLGLVAKCVNLRPTINHSCIFLLLCCGFFYLLDTKHKHKYHESYVCRNKLRHYWGKNNIVCTSTN